MKTILYLMALAACTIPGIVWGAEYQLSPGNDVFGEINVIVPDSNTTFVNIARRYDVAFTELEEANPNVDPWNPGGQHVIVPRKHIVPNGPREGIVINLAELRLYYFKDGGHRVVTYPVGIGQMEWATPVISGRISDKRVHPDWVIPEIIRTNLFAKGYRMVPHMIAAGPDNPLGDYAMRVGNTDLLIHGTDYPDGVGRRISHGCVRLYPEDVQSLFHQVPIGTPVRIVHEPYKFGWSHGKLFMEYHAALHEFHESPEQVAVTMKEALNRYVQGHMVSLIPGMLDLMLHRADGMPGVIAHGTAMGDASDNNAIEDDQSQEISSVEQPSDLGSNAQIEELSNIKHTEMLGENNQTEQSSNNPQNTASDNTSVPVQGNSNSGDARIIDNSSNNGITWVIDNGN